ncbi:hypothetical protein BJF78_08450 [Pseudonocardia sp. CNS-139]|nr:hypothetical protein BJF78_08450 [Pseudonocardia sp. CNS-139]
MTDYSAVRQYKEIVAGIAAAAEELRERDRRRAAELAVQLGELEDERHRVAERAALTTLGVELQWEAALEALWVESWMTLRRRPAPDPRADPAHLGHYEAEVEQRAAELLDAVRRRRFGLPRR